jgi:hypothetical protein
MDSPMVDTKDLPLRLGYDIGGVISEKMYNSSVPNETSHGLLCKSDFKQSPSKSLYHLEKIINKYVDGVLFSFGFIVTAREAFDNNLYDACSDILNDKTFDNVEKIHKKSRWVRKASQFCFEYFQGDFLAMTDCLKSVDEWKTCYDLDKK